MDSNNGESRNSQGDSLALNANDQTFRVGQNGALPTFATQAQLANGSAQLQISSPALNQEPRQDVSKGQTRQDGVSNTNVSLAISEVAGAVPQAVSTAAASDDGRGQVAVETSAGSVSGTVVIPQEYLAVAAGAQTYVPTEAHNVNESVGLTVEDMEQDEKDRDEEVLREQDRFLPIANVARIMKKSIPNTGKIAKDAKECVQECVSEFISFITSEASERCHQEKRKTINGEDILFAMTTLGFDQYVEPLKIYLQKYRDSMKGEKGSMGTVSEGSELDDEGRNISQYSSGPMHPTMIAPEQASAIYGTAYQAQIPQSIHFPSM